MPKVRGTARTCENPVAAIIRLNSAGGGNPPTDAGRYEYALEFLNRSSHERAAGSGNTGVQRPDSGGIRGSRTRGWQDAPGAGDARQSASALAVGDVSDAEPDRRGVARTVGEGNARGVAANQLHGTVSRSPRSLINPSRSISPEKSTPTTGPSR